MTAMVIRRGQLYREHRNPDTGRRSWRKVPHLNLVCPGCGWWTLAIDDGSLTPVRCLCGVFLIRVPDWAPPATTRKGGDVK